ncbi:SusC/RagA family TonB-linked outer membrane protein [Wenyingzhuangia marina]|nr:SusC/RagA family TonB-linked outer membrane protein [Wenyingzhuangia marina]
MFDNLPKVSVKRGVILTNDLLNKSLSKGNFKILITKDNSIVIKERFIKSVAQQKKHQISGVILDTEGQPLPGATVVEKGTNNGVITSFDGDFNLNVNDQAILVVSYVGYISKEIQLGSEKSLTIILASDMASLDEIVLVGYGTQKKVNLTGSVSSISSKEIENRPITQASQALSGLASGVTVQQGSGRPGNDGASIRLRGIGTFSGAGNDPLVLIDGLAGSLNDVDPNNIKSISVLKDAASASIYGTRAANGVILIETKRGRKGELTVSYNGYIGTQKVTALPDFVDSATYATLRNEANANMNSGPSYTDAEIEKFRNQSDPDNYPNVPHLKNLLKSGSGLQMSHNFSFSGGDEKNSYLFSLGYLDQDGIIAENNYKRYNFQLNFDSQIKKNLKLTANLSGYSANTEEPRHIGGDMTNMMNFAVRQGPIFAGKKSDGTYGYQDNYSPQAWLDSESFTNRKNKLFLGGTELAWDFMKNFTLSGKVGYRYTNYRDKEFLSDLQFDANKYVGPNSLRVSSGFDNTITLQSLLKYAVNVDKHSIAALAGFSQEEFHSEFVSGYRDDFPNNLLYEINAGSSSNMQNSGSAGEWGLRSYFGRINYSFNDRYLFEVNGRYDGTSRFITDGRWGFFPSVSAGWKVSEENFLKEVKWIDNLKFRASWGQLGNQNIGNYPYQNVIDLGQNYTFGGSLVSGARLSTLSNANISWETTTVTDLGLDVNLFDGKFSMVFDYFDKITSDILDVVSVSGVLGLNPSTVNAGEVRNSGFEVLLNYQDKIGDVNFSISPNFSYTNNRVTKLSTGLNQDINRGLFVGHSVNSTYGYVADGLFVDANDVANYPTQPYAAEPGFVKYKDISGPDGVPDGKVDATYDRKVIGSYFPKYSFGANLQADYKGFDISVLLQGLAGFNRQIGAYQAYAFYNGGQIQQWQADNRWTEENPDPNAEYIKLTSLNQGSGTIRPSTFWDRNASFLRIKNVQIGYNFPKPLLDALKIQKLRIYVTGQNLHTFNSFYKGWDPEMSQSTGDNSPFYPITSVYTLGLNLNF